MKDFIVVKEGAEGIYEEKSQDLLPRYIKRITKAKPVHT